MQMPSALKKAIERLPVRQRQVLMLLGLLTVMTVVLWVVFSASESKKPPVPTNTMVQPGSAHVTNVENLGVMPGGAQVSPLDQWVGSAGKKLAQYERDKQDQDRQNTNAQEFQKQTLERFAKLEQTLQGQAAAQPMPQSAATPGSPEVAGASPAYPQQPLPPPPAARAAGASLPPGAPGQPVPAPQPLEPMLVRVSLGAPTKTLAENDAAPGTASKDGELTASHVDTFLPVSFTRGILLGGLDAPTGGQAQSNPHPVLIRLEDSAVLPNQHRTDIRECFVVAAGYGDISSERAYLRTETLSCVRNNGSTIEVGIKGSVYGEDGKVGMRGRLVSKQGQMLARALLAGVVGGIGQGFGQRDVTFSTSALGTVGTTSGDEAFRAGIGNGVGRALDRLAQYYIRLAEQTFPVIEVDAGREVDVVITKGVRIEAEQTAKERPTSGSAARRDELIQVADDEY